MRQMLRTGLLLCAALYSAATGADTAPATTATELRVAVHDTLTLDFPGATAAFAVDTDIVEASASGNRLVLVGRRAGQTLVTVILPASVETLTVHVDAASTGPQTFERAGAGAMGSAELGYDSGLRRYSAGLDLPFGDATRGGRLQLFGLREEAVAGDDTWALPSASLELHDPGRRLVLLDELVNASPLTLNYNVLRGVHLHQGPLEIHAGVASATPWSDLLLPSSGDDAAEISYRYDAGPVRLVPRLLWLPDSSTDVPGVVALGVERGGLQDPFWLKAELGWSDQPGASLDLGFRNTRRQLWLQGSTRPAEFAALNVARPAGDYLDGAWTESLTHRLTGSLTLSGSRLELLSHEPESASARLELRHQTSMHWSLTTGAGVSSYRDDGRDALQRSTALAGIAYDLPNFGIAALYRYQESSDASRAGQGGRFTVRAAAGAWRANLFVDAQEQVPTLDLIFQDRPDLARAFAELGFIATTPEEVIRLLRDNAALFAAQGVTVGELHVSPLRLQGGLNLAWRQPGPRHPEIGLRALADAAQGAASERRSYLASAYTTWPVFRNSELQASYVYWAAERENLPDTEHDSWQLTFRTRFAGPHLPGSGQRPITGQVLRDDLGSGELRDGQPALADVEVVLDGWRHTRTDADGRFSFASPGPGEHRVQAMLPAEPGAYFTRPSSVSVPAGGDTRFAITLSAARLSGTVTTDAGLPLAGVTVRLKGAAEASTTTDSSGTFRLAGPGGPALVSVVAESLPPGYELRGLRPQPVLLAKGAPASAAFSVRAQRVLTGVVKGLGAEPVTISAVEAHEIAGPDRNGAFLFRGLPAGRLTLVVRSQRGETRQTVEMPAEPGTVAGIELLAPGARH